MRDIKDFEAMSAAELLRQEAQLEQKVKQMQQKRTEVQGRYRYLMDQYAEGTITKGEYEEKLRSILENRSPDQWLKYYDGHINHYQDQLNRCRKTAGKRQATKKRKLISISVIAVAASICFLVFCPGIITFGKTAEAEKVTRVAASDPVYDYMKINALAMLRDFGGGRKTIPEQAWSSETTQDQKTTTVALLDKIEDSSDCRINGITSVEKNGRVAYRIRCDEVIGVDDESLTVVFVKRDGQYFLKEVAAEKVSP